MRRARPLSPRARPVNRDLTARADAATRAPRLRPAERGGGAAGAQPESGPSTADGALGRHAVINA